jgi:hypothetical protein
MAYLLPRIVIVLIAWGMTCGLISRLWHGTDLTIFGVAGACWAFGGIAYFAYLRKLSRDIEELERNHCYRVNHDVTESTLSPAE